MQVKSSKGEANFTQKFTALSIWVYMFFLICWCECCSKITDLCGYVGKQGSAGILDELGSKEGKLSLPTTGIGWIHKYVSTYLVQL